jgi:hypothetical protein
MWSGRDAIRSTDLGWVNFKVSKIAFVSSTLKESTSPGIATDSRVS